ncbi:hypothetical protein [Bradyrhizobium sp.]|uniref:hypothetical protein n=1 Tax=Bradyrhizobium sp. TaxID=376 RepID=UPI004037C661
MTNIPGGPFPEGEVRAAADRPPDELILQHLGAAVMLCWSRLPLGTREQILNQAGDVLGLAPASREEIVTLLLRHSKAQWSAEKMR